MENSYNTQGFPAQKIKSSQKNKEWGRKCVDAICTYLSTNNLYNPDLSNYAYKKLKYDIVNGKINPEDMKYVIDPMSISEELGSQPARFQNYAKIYPKINYLVSKEAEMPLNFRAYIAAGQGFSEKNEFKVKKINDIVRASVQKKMFENGLIGEDEMEDESFTIEALQKYVSYGYQDIREQFVNTLLKDLVHKLSLKQKFNKGFKHATIVAEEIYHVGIINGEPSVRVVNPLYFDYIRTVELEQIENSQAAREIIYMQPSEIIDEYGEYLTPGEIDKIEGFGHQTNKNAFLINEGYHLGRDDFDSNGSGIPVMKTAWKSMRMIQFLKYFDEFSEIQETIIDDDTFKIPEELKPYVIEHTKEWIIDVWEGVRIIEGGDEEGIYPYIRPMRNQLEGGALPYIGNLYNSLNSTPTSPLDFLIPYQNIINVFLYKLELEVNKADGRKFIMDAAQIPKSQGWTTKEWMYYFKNLGIAFINSAEEGLDSQGGSKFNQFTSVDMGMSSTVGEYINLVNHFESMMDEIVGISRQAQGEIAASETATGVNTAITQTSVQTKPLFMTHNEVKRRVLTHIVDIAKLCMVEGKYRVNFMDDMMMQMSIEIEGNKLNDSDYSIYITDGIEEQKVFEALRRSAEMAIQSGQMKLSAITTIFRNGSVSEAQKYLEGVENKMEQSQQAQAQAEQEQANADRQLEQQRYMDQIALEQARMENDNLNKQLDRENKIQIESMKLGAVQDTDGDQIPDVIEQSRLAMEINSNFFDQNIKQREAQRKDSELMFKANLEKEKINLQREKLKVDKENQKNDLEIAKINARNKNKATKK